jgi:hypothetical protein
VRRGAVPQRVEQEAEPRLRLLLAHAEQLEDLALHLGRVDADGAAADLRAVQHEVVGARAHLPRAREVAARGGERVVQRGPALVGLLEHREVDDPQDVVPALGDEPEAAAELQAQAAERGGRHLLGVGDEQEQVAVGGADRVRGRVELVLGEELGDGRAPAAAVDPRPGDGLAAVALDDLAEALELRPAHRARAGVEPAHDAAGAQHALEDLELRAGERLAEL